MSIMSVLSRRVSRRTVRRSVDQARQGLVAAAQRYRDGTPAELSAHAELRGRLQRELRAAYFAGVGRRIDLFALLAEQREQSGRVVPRWAIVDPRAKVSHGNCSDSWGVDGQRIQSGVLVGCTLLSPHATHGGDTGERLGQRYIRGRVSGLPALPPRVREIIRSPLMRHTRLVGVVYQPEEWQLVNPDPALVVEWTDLPGEYYALAVWGGDRARIMEFVD